ncbi:hypothetical protein BDV93DRAFT_564348 [Ceratobasidium sp. AG-I]|nr:hypothetical protein BDV93DRAFT_564348 [Ceratobasidium sp. AG-I]
MSDTERRIFAGKPVRKQGYVIRVEDTHLMVAYTTTFGKQENLSNLVTDPNAWYPIVPASTSNFLSLPAPIEEQTESVPCWVYLGPLNPVENDPVETLPGKAIPTGSVEKIIAALLKPKNRRAQRGPLRHVPELHVASQASKSSTPSEGSNAQVHEAVAHPGDRHTVLNAAHGQDKEEAAEQPQRQSMEADKEAEEKNTAVKAVTGQGQSREMGYVTTTDSGGIGQQETQASNMAIG